MPTRKVVASPLAGRATPRPTYRKLYTKAWDAASRRFLAEPANNYCRECERQGRVEVATQTDHVIPHRGDVGLFWDRSNWQPLCQSCHSSKTARGE